MSQLRRGLVAIKADVKRRGQSHQAPAEVEVDVEIVGRAAAVRRNEPRVHHLRQRVARSAVPRRRCVDNWWNHLIDDYDGITSAAFGKRGRGIGRLGGVESWRRSGIPASSGVVVANGSTSAQAEPSAGRDDAPRQYGEQRSTQRAPAGPPPQPSKHTLR
jgi:hypothetical protein